MTTATAAVDARTDGLGPTLCLARQPILDDRGRVFGYELLYRATPLDVQCTASSDAASARVLTAAISAIGLDALTGGRPAFVNFTRELLLTGATLLPPASLVIELHESMPVDGDVVESCRRLVDQGYAIGLDDYTPGTDADALLPFAKFVKVDVLATAPGTRAWLATHLAPRGLRLVAEKVETVAMAEQARADGYRLFQGHHFVRPSVFSARTVPEDRAACLRLLGAVNRPDLSIAQLEDLVKADVSLCHKVLRSINSSAFGLRRQVSTIREALVLLGRDQIRRLASVWALSRLNDGGTAETLTVGLMRAYACQGLGARARALDAHSDLFLLGLCSVLDTIVGQPMSELVAALPLAGPIRDALIQRPSPVAPVLEAAVAYEDGRWIDAASAAGRVGLPPSSLPDAYNDALRWTRALPVTG